MHSEAFKAFQHTSGPLAALGLLPKADRNWLSSPNRSRFYGLTDHTALPSHDACLTLGLGIHRAFSHHIQCAIDRCYTVHYSSSPDPTARRRLSRLGRLTPRRSHSVDVAVVSPASVAAP